MFMKWFAVMAALPMAALSLAGPAGAAPLAAVRAGEMQLRVLAAGHFDLAYRGVPLIRDGSFYLADDRWTTVYPVAGVHTLRPVVKEAPESAEVRLVSAENPLCMATQEFSVTGDSLSYALEYEVKPGTAARYAVCDLFLNKDVLAGAAYRGEAGAKPAAGTLDVAKTGHVLPGLATATFTTIVGEVTLTAASVPVGEDAGPGTPWVLRNVSDRPWGAEELRTFSALNQAELAEGAGIRQRLTFSLQVKPAADLDARLAAAGMERGLRALLGAEKAAAAVAGLPAEPAARAGALQKELDAACRSWQGARAAAQERKPFIIPEPQEMRLGRGGFALPAGLVLSVASNLSSREGTGIATLVEELQERFGVRAQVRPAGKAPARGAILIGEPSRNPLVAAWLKKAGIAVTPQSPGPEGYVLHVTPDTVVVAGSDAAGTFYGIQSLIQLLRRDARGKVTLPEVAIRDWPAMKWRGIHIWGLGGSATADDLRRVVRRVAARYKLNTVMFGNSYRAFRWKSHPEITPPGRGMPIEELAGIAQYARDHFQEFVPAFQSLGHVEDLVALHPEIAEAPATERAHSNAYCPSNPDTYRLLFDLWTEVINAVHPRYFHAGHDEVSHIGVCDRCKATPHADLYAGDVAKLHDWLKAHGAEMIIWGDMLLSQEEWRPKGVDAANGTTSAANPRGTDAAVGLLPKDVIIADWHYNAAAEFPTLAHFAGKGLRVLGCPWYGDRNNHNLALAARKAGVLGTVVTDWGFLVVNSAAACSVLGPAYAWSPGRGAALAPAIRCPRRPLHAGGDRRAGQSSHFLRRLERPPGPVRRGARKRPLDGARRPLHAGRHGVPHPGGGGRPRPVPPPGGRRTGRARRRRGHPRRPARGQPSHPDGVARGVAQRVDRRRRPDGPPLRGRHHRGVRDEGGPARHRLAHLRPAREPLELARGERRPLRGEAGSARLHPLWGGREPAGRRVGEPPPRTRDRLAGPEGGPQGQRALPGGAGDDGGGRRAGRQPLRCTCS